MIEETSTITVTYAAPDAEHQIIAVALPKPNIRRWAVVVKAATWRNGRVRELEASTEEASRPRYYDECPTTEQLRDAVEQFVGDLRLYDLVDVSDLVAQLEPLLHEHVSRLSALLDDPELGSVETERVAARLAAVLALEGQGVSPSFSSDLQILASRAAGRLTVGDAGPAAALARAIFRSVRGAHATAPAKWWTTPLGRAVSSRLLNVESPFISASDAAVVLRQSKDEVVALTRDGPLELIDGEHIPRRAVVALLGEVGEIGRGPNVS